MKAVVIDCEWDVRGLCIFCQSIQSERMLHKFIEGLDPFDGDFLRGQSCHFYWTTTLANS